MAASGPGTRLSSAVSSTSCSVARRSTTPESLRTGRTTLPGCGRTCSAQAASTASACGADLDRNGACGNFFAMLWRDSDNKVLVDSDNDLSFADESFMTDYKVNYDIGHFGHDNPATPVSESVPFVVQTDPAKSVCRHRHRLRRPRNACLGHCRRQQPVRRPDERRGSRGEDRHGSRLPLHRRLHLARVDRGNDLRDRDGPRGRRQHEHRRPAGAERRQQRPRDPLQPPDRGQRRPDVHLGRQRRPGNEHDRRSRPWPRR